MISLPNSYMYKLVASGNTCVLVESLECYQYQHTKHVPSAVCSYDLIWHTLLCYYALSSLCFILYTSLIIQSISGEFNHPEMNNTHTHTSHTHSLTHSLSRSLNHTLAHSLTRSCTHTLTPGMLVLFNLPTLCLWPTDRRSGLSIEYTVGGSPATIIAWQHTEWPEGNYVIHHDHSAWKIPGVTDSTDQVRLCLPWGEWAEHLCAVCTAVIIVWLSMQVYHILQVYSKEFTEDKETLDFCDTKGLALYS